MIDTTTELLSTVQDCVNELFSLGTQNHFSEKDKTRMRKTGRLLYVVKEKITQLISNPYVVVLDPKRYLSEKKELMDLNNEIVTLENKLIVLQKRYRELNIKYNSSEDVFYSKAIGLHQL